MKKADSIFNNLCLNLDETDMKGTKILKLNGVKELIQTAHDTTLATNKWNVERVRFLLNFQSE